MVQHYAHWCEDWYWYYTNCEEEIEGLGKENSSFDTLLDNEYSSIFAFTLTILRALYWWDKSISVGNKTKGRFQRNNHRFCADAAKQLSSRQKCSIVYLY